MSGLEGWMFSKQSPTENPRGSRQMGRWDWHSGESPGQEACGWGRCSPGRQRLELPTSQMCVESAFCDSTFSLWWLNDWGGDLPCIINTEAKLGHVLSRTSRNGKDRNGAMSRSTWLHNFLCSLLHAGKDWDILSTHRKRNKKSWGREGERQTDKTTKTWEQACWARAPSPDSHPC